MAEPLNSETPRTDALAAKFQNESKDDLSGAFSEALDLCEQLERWLADSKKECPWRSAGVHECKAAWEKRFASAPLGYVLVELDAINNFCGRLNALIDAGSADAKSLAADAALLLEALRG